ncbi:hypothetical protein [Clostridium estertheticum]|uniref:hypothetical protein n=1 Tax=Clostridium estertheticum TaxID=238834 RepID=UPI001C0D03AA|nr:hypothetical protein [Clostridium estertheticum]MBU3186622.1 hypothetical protein [Clostridium estertheticum]
MSPSEFEKLKTERCGKVSINKFGDRMEIIKYNYCSDITVKFDSGYITKSSYNSFIKGSLKSPYSKSVYGHGYLGEGIYMPKDQYKKRTKQYLTWQEMLRRCYDKALHKRYPTYIGCVVAPEWHNFQNFGKWYDENIYEAEDQEMNLDKDILFKGNKLYSPNTCVFAPKRINVLFIKGDANRGNYPIGMSWDSSRNRFRACCNNGLGKCIKLGSFHSIPAAFEAYKIFKEDLIKNVANMYKLLIPTKLYQAMVNYRVEIAD